MTIEHRIPVDLEGERLDRAVAVLGGLSRAAARALVDAGEARLDGEVHPASHRVHARQLVTIPAAKPTPELEPEFVPFDVVYESSAVRVVDKPPGVVVHPGAGHDSGTLASGLLDRFADTMDAAHRWGLVHRLDRETSGLLAVARHEAALAALQADLKRRAVGRVYWALVVGELAAATGTIEAPVGRDPHQPTRMAVTRDGRHARTHYEVVARWDDVTLAEVTLDTGRTHQIRVHLSSIGHPVVGDTVYGRGRHRGDPGRVWLHATRLSFTDPDTGQGVRVTSPMPIDLSVALDELGPPAEGSVPGSSAS